MPNRMYETSKPTSYRGIRQAEDGTFLVRVRLRGPTGKEVCKQAQTDGDLSAALELAAELRRQARVGPMGLPQRPLFSEYATSLYERKVAVRELKSAKSRERWEDTLTHHLVPALGDVPVDALKARDVRHWLLAQAKRQRVRPSAETGEPVEVGPYSAATINGWLRILLTILREAKADLELEHDPTAGVNPLPQDDPYSEEEPNSLTPEEFGPFMAKARELYPRYHAFLLLGLVTGRRPSELRPLRRRGPEADVLWDERRLLIRRSETLGEVMNTTKTGVKLKIALHEEVVAILRRHVDELPTGKPRESDLLFPGWNGWYMRHSELDKPIRHIAAEAKIFKTLTPRCMRRSYQDLMRAAGVADVVVRSMSGHLTEEMQQHYSSVSGAEQAEAQGKVLAFIGRRAA